MSVQRQQSIHYRAYSEIGNMSRSSSNAESSPTAVETAYSRLDSFTLEPPPSQAEYDTMSKPEYVNVNGTATEVMCDTDTTPEELRSDAGSSSNVSPSSTSSYSQLDSSTSEPRQPPASSTD